jgi:tetratricopeptide (TPR) repeat protein
MLVLLQVIALAGLSLLFAAFILATWLGFFPEEDFLEFVKQTGTILPLIGLLTVYSSLLALILGWKPNLAIIDWFRSRIIVPTFTQIRPLSVLILFAFASFVAAIQFAFSFQEKHHAEILEAVASENFARADRLISSSALSAERTADLYIFNESERQLYFKSTGDPDTIKCQLYYTYFKNRRHAFQPAWMRYVFHVSEAACLNVLDDPKQAITQYQRALKLTKWLGPDQARLTSRRIAAIYLRDKRGLSDIPDEATRSRRILALLATDPEDTAIRMRGAALYSLGEYSKAAQEWEKAVNMVKPQDDLEKKKLINNLALSYLRIGQSSLALTRVNTGLALPYDVQNEAQRREQVRLLSTKVEVLKNQNQCPSALDVFEEREKLKRQDRSPCTALLEARIRACMPDSSENKTKLFGALLFGVGQSAASFVDFTKNALSALVKQSAAKFEGECYVGLAYGQEAVERAVLSLAKE